MTAATPAFNPVWAVGLMTGTVLDGNVDVALLRTDGELVQHFGPWALHPYPPKSVPSCNARRTPPGAGTSMGRSRRCSRRRRPR